MDGPDEGTPLQTRQTRPTRRARRRARRQARSPLASAVRAGLGAVALVLLLTVAWVGARGALAARHLQAARSQVATAKAAIALNDLPAAATAAELARKDTRSARRLTSDVVWRLVAQVPGVGPTLASTADLAASADDVATGALPPLIASAQVLDAPGGGLRRADGNGIDLGVLSTVSANLTAASTALQRAQLAAHAIPQHQLVGAVSQARGQLVTQVDELAKQVVPTAAGAQAALPLLGGGSEKHFLLELQNEAESRGTGGLIGTYAILTAKDGALTLDSVGSDNDLVDPDPPIPVVGLGAAFDARYGTFGVDSSWLASNVTPDFPTAATIALALWKHQTGQQLDGVIAIDPTLVGYLLSATGPVTLPDGTSLAGDQVAPFTESTLYAKYPGPPGSPAVAQRKTVLVALVQQTFDHLRTGQGSTRALLDALGKGVDERRLLVSSTDPVVQTALAEASLSGALPTAQGPYATVVLNNAGGNKLDYYTERTLDYRTDPGCGSALRGSTITVTLHNTAPATGLPDYVSGRAPKAVVPGLVPGQNRLWVSFYAAAGARLTAATKDGQPVNLAVGTEGVHAVYSGYVELKPGASSTFVLQLTEPTAGGFSRAVPQPMVVPERVTDEVTVCR